MYSKKCKPIRGDILLGKAATVGVVAVIDFDFEINIWSPIALIRLGKKAKNTFIYYFFQSDRLKRQIGLLTNSSSQGNIGMGDIEQLIFLLPTVEEQTAIASILSDMDSDISNLQQRLTKTRQIKQGMMQQLLTGRIRLI